MPWIGTKDALLRRTTTELRRLSLGPESLAASCALVLLATASYPILVHRHAVSLHAPPPQSVTLLQFRFASLFEIKSRQDLHIQ